MDAFLAREAGQALEALSAVSSAAHLKGCLLGHKRGGRVMIEKVLPVPAGFDPTPENIVRLDRIFRGRVVGFFAPRGSSLKKDLLQPIACGRLFVSVQPRRHGGLGLTSFLIEYDGRFALNPVKLVREKEGRT